MKKVFLVGFAVAVFTLSVTGGIAGATTFYSLTDLGTINNSPAFWMASDASDINNLGQVTGSSTAISINGDLTFHGFFWDKNNGMIDLGTFTGNIPISGTYPETYPYAINDLGQITGGIIGGGDGLRPAFVWDNLNGFTDLSSYFIGDAVGYDINNSGQVVGYGGIASFNSTDAFIWDSTIGITVLGDGGANAINESGQAVGDLDGGHSFIWDATNGVVDLGVLGLGDDDMVSAQDINNQGQVVGITHDRYSSDKVAFIWDSINGIVDLNTLIDTTGSGWHVSTAMGINDLGQIVGTAHNDSGQRRAVLLNPVVPTIENILTFFDESVEQENIYGRGTGWLAQLRLRIMRKLLEISGEFIEKDRLNTACFILKRANTLCDGELLPREDLVEGSATVELANMIEELIAYLGCE
jgi:probable HAF family extracellular repeat protein